eukprot:snap_masked-scaffold_17-processed-gene-0.35-mRNA-1 protein AED:1.00 eAED:1.00 QI:0/-1/0/0/-1/1/1/0/65
MLVVASSLNQAIMLHAHLVFIHGAKGKELEFMKNNHSVRRGMRTLYDETYVIFRKSLCISRNKVL